MTAHHTTRCSAGPPAMLRQAAPRSTSGGAAPDRSDVEPGGCAISNPHHAAPADFTSAYQAVARVVRESGLLRRARWFYYTVFAALCAGLVGAGVGFVLLRD